LAVVPSAGAAAGVAAGMDDDSADWLAVLNRPPISTVPRSEKRCTA
jgi:hypothetical protein